MTTKTDDKQEAAHVDSARAAGAPSSARDTGPKTTAAERAEAWHRKHDAASAAAQQKRDVENAEYRERDRERGKQCEAAVTRAIEAHEERVSELRKAEAKVEQLRAERDHIPADFHERIDRVVGAAEVRIRKALARPVDGTLPHMVPRLDPKLAVDWLLATDPRLAERWHEVSSEEMAASARYSDRASKDIKKDLDGASKEADAARKSEREAHTALGTARKALYEWGAGR